MPPYDWGVRVMNPPFLLCFSVSQASFNFIGPISESGESIALASAQAGHVVVSSPVVVEEAPSRGIGDASVRTPRAIILEPARELAEQVSECLTAFKVRFKGRHATGLPMRCVYCV